MESLITFVAGLGLFFVGLDFLTVNLKKLTDKALREKIAKWTQNRFLGLLWGGVFIMTTQSSSAATFILVGMVRAGMMAAKQTMPIITGVNAFGGVVIFLLVMDIRLAVLAVLGLTGLIYAGSQKSKWRQISGAIFGIAVLFLGISYLQLAVNPLIELEGFNQAAEWLQGKFFIAFMVGILATTVVQSSLPPVILMIPLAQINLLSLDEAMMFVYGTNVGNSVLTYVFTTKFTGKSKQVAMFQVTYNLICALILLPLFYIEYYTGTPLIKAFVESISSGIGQQISIVYLIFNAMPGVVLIFLISQFDKILDKIWPISLEEKLSKPIYIRETVYDDPGIVIDLIELEQSRLVGLLGNFFEKLRNGDYTKESVEMSEALKTLSQTIYEVIQETSEKEGISNKGYERLNHLLKIQHSIENINETLDNIRQEMDNLSKQDFNQNFIDGLVEGLDVVLLSLIDFIRNKQSEDWEVFMSITSKDGNGISSVRKQYLSKSKDLTPEEKLSFLSVANQAELLIWLFRDIGKKYMSKYQLNMG